MNSTLWTEKYRPKSADEFAGPKHIKDFLSNSLKNGFPHLLLYGPPGTGKTTFATLLAGREFLELNASDERGIGTIRNKVKNYASSISSNNVIILDECELMTKDAQHCLRRIIEDYTQTRFIFITNYVCKIIAPLKSRLLKIKFEFSNTLDVLSKIIEKEKLNIKFADKIYAHFNFDLRKCINIIQGIAPLDNYNLNDLLGIVDEKFVEMFWRLKPSEIESFTLEFIRSANCLLQFLKQISESMKGTDKQKAKLIQAISLIESRTIIGCNEEILVRLLCCNKVNIYG